MPFHTFSNFPFLGLKYPLQHSLVSDQTIVLNTLKILDPILGGPSQPGLAIKEYIKKF